MNKKSKNIYHNHNRSIVYIMFVNPAKSRCGYTSSLH